MGKSQHSEIDEVRRRHEELRRQPLSAPGPIRVSKPDMLRKLQALGHPVELIPESELPEILERLKDPDENNSLR